MNNLDYYFGLIIMGDQVCRIDQILNSKYVRFIHRRMKSYMWHVITSLT
jgi:hypothetical protein